VDGVLPDEGGLLLFVQQPASQSSFA
jgi:hypothetical protein